MVRTFDEPAAPAVLAFWRLIASWEKPRYYMSGGPERHLSGWISAFCFWSAQGKRQWPGSVFEQERDWSLEEGQPNPCVPHQADGITYPRLKPEAVELGSGHLPVRVRWIDGGVLMGSWKYRMVAGLVGMRPGRPMEMGVDLEGTVVPDAERNEEGEDVEERDVRVYDVKGRQIRPGMERKRRWWDPQPSQVNPKAPAASEGFTAVRPEVGWWIFEESAEQCVHLEARVRAAEDSE